MQKEASDRPKKVGSSKAPQTTESKQIPINCFFDAKTVEQIDDFQFGNRIRFRVEAIRQLVRKGLEAK